MSTTRIPPHLAEPKLVYATQDASEAYITAVARGFHGDYTADHWELETKVFEWDRTFGFTVEDRWISTCGAFSRTMTVPGGAVPVAAVTIVTVAPSYRRRGLLNQMMRHQLEDVQNRGIEPVALLWASESLIYGRYGYGHATPRLQISGLTRSTSFRPSVTLGSGSTDEVTREEYVTAAAGLRDELLAQRPGSLNRTADWWNVNLYDPEAWRKGASALRFALHFGASGQVDGYASFRVGGDSDDDQLPGRQVVVGEVDAATPDAYAGLWRYLLDLDLVRSFRQYVAPLDEPLRHLVDDQRAIKSEILDGTYARLVDLPSALEARGYSRDVDTVIEVHDALLPANAGTFRLQTGSDGASVTRSTASPDLSLDTRELGASYLGGTSLESLHRAGLVQEHRPGAVTALAAALHWPIAPFCADFF